MQIKEIFKKDIARPINGVVKADQLDEAIVWQELDEYVVTRELDQHLRRFVSAYLTSVDKSHDPVVTSRIGVWVSGFFGSGKSHFIKILSYLLSNRQAVNPETGSAREAIDFFKDKIVDPMLLADLKRMSGIATDVILFNIDSKADANDGRSAVLATLWRVFNESQGFSGDFLHLAEMERYLSEKGRYEAFKDKFRELQGSQWEDERDAYAFHKDEIVAALSSVLAKSAQAARDWFQQSEKEFSLTIENFAKCLKAYLDTRSTNHRIVFLIDEMGQFIGSDTHLMLNLQTIVEDLGRICHGRVWVLVTSQEDIDKVLGDIRAARANDFSKIQGRFNTRLSLSSSNTDEVIQARLLEKTKAAQRELENLFGAKGDIVKSQLGFSHDGPSLKTFSDAKAFTTNYPFAPFHFQLVQNIFESIRKAGATGLHLARGERSMLDAFQSAAVRLAECKLGALVPLYEFFPCIENFLDTAVMLSINSARDNPGLSMPFDLQLLQTLFLIRYVELIKANVDNLVTLCIDQVDADRIHLKEAIEASLVRLEKQNLINRNGDLYFFLTNDEREVSREIKGVTIPSAAESQLLGDIIFEDVLKGNTKYRYKPYNNDYPFSRVCDGRIWGREVKDDLGLEVISPLHDEYTLFTPGKCNLYSANKDGHVIAKLPDDRHLGAEIRTYLQTDKYIKDKSDAAASVSLKRILRDRADENRNRRKRLTALVEALLSQAEFYALGRKLDISGQTSARLLNAAFDHLVQNVFSKYGYLTHQFDDPLKEIKQILLSDDISQQQLVMAFEKAEPSDIKEIRTFIDLKEASGQPVILSDLVRHFAKRPYGWGDLQVVVLIAKLFMSGAIGLVVEGSKLAPKEAETSLTKTPQWKKVKIIQRINLSAADAEKARKLGKELFGKIAPDGQDPLAQFIRDGLRAWKQVLEKFKPLADTGKYPGKKEIDNCLAAAASIRKIHDAYECVKAFTARRDALREASDDLYALKDFYDNQKSTWVTLQDAMERFRPNRNALEKDVAAGPALQQMEQILSAPSPYGMLKDVDGLVSQVETVNQALLTEKRKGAVAAIDDKIHRVSVLLKDHSADADFSNRSLYPLQEIKKKVATEYSLPQIVTYAVNDAQELYEETLKAIDDAFPPPGARDQKPKPVKTIKAASMQEKAFLETAEDVEHFVANVREKLLEEVRCNRRVRIE